MSIFFQKIVLYICTTLIVVNILLWFLLKSYPDYFTTDIRDYHIVKEQYDRISTANNSKNIIIGDSRGNTGIVSEVLGAKYNNFSIPGSSFVEGYFTLRFLLKHQKLDAVILGYGLNYLHDGNHWFDKRTVRINNDLTCFNDIRNINEMELKNSLGIDGTKDIFLFDLKSILRHLKRNLLFFKFPIMYTENFWNNLDMLLFKRKSRINSLQSVNFHNGNFTFPQEKLVGTDFRVLEEMEPYNPIILNYSDSIITLCNRNNIKAILCVPPSLTEYPKEVFHLFRRKGYSIIYPVKLDKEYFSDHTHLNKKGALINSNYLKAHLNNVIQ